MDGQIHILQESRAYGREESIYTGTGQKMTDTAFKWLNNN